MKKDIDIARSVKIKPIEDIAKILGIHEDMLHHYGSHKAKLPLNLIDEERVQQSKLILVTAITPTPAGEGKTTTSIGLAQALNCLGKKATVVLREPSLGPVFGIKGGAAGGGFSQVIPMEDINLHFTGDLSAVEKAHNLLTALIDNNIQNKRYSLGLDARTIRWKRVIDMNDRSLRDIIIGLGGTRKGIPRETGFDITAASEVMAALCMATDLGDLKRRFGNFFIGMTMDDQPVFARDLKAQGAMAALMKYAVMPNLVQTLEGTPAIIHGGPFANIAQGTNSIIATKMGMTLSDYVVTEAGFASELGAEKFFNLKCQNGKFSPKAAVIVATIRALKYHGGSKIAELKEENMGTLEKGFENLDKHIENIQYYGFEPVVAINRFNSDTDKELALLQTYLEEKGIMVSLTESWEKGGEGAVDLAEKVIDAMKKCPACFKPLYNFDQDMETKIHAIATKMYGADNVEYALQAKKDLDLIKQLGFEHLGVCIAKTQKSISDDKYKKGRPRGFTVKIREIEISSGAGFVVPISGSIMRMPGLPSIPSAEQIDIDEAGNISGLF